MYYLNAIVKLVSITMFLSLIACAGDVKKPNPLLSIKNVYFPNEIPIKGLVKIEGLVSNVVRCPQRQRCLVANHLIIISPNANQAYIKARGLLVFPDNVNKFKIGNRYQFIFKNGQYVRAKAV